MTMKTMIAVLATAAGLWAGTQALAPAPAAAFQESGCIDLVWTIYCETGDTPGDGDTGSGDVGSGDIGYGDVGSTDDTSGGLPDAISGGDLYGDPTDTSDAGSGDTVDTPEEVPDAEVPPVDTSAPAGPQSGGSAPQQPAAGPCDEYWARWRFVPLGTAEEVEALSNLVACIQAFPDARAPFADADPAHGGDTTVARADTTHGRTAERKAPAAQARRSKASTKKPSRRHASRKRRPGHRKR